ncbi:dGTPase [Actinomyces radicidentis]|uniref:dGTPase n=1 Tax=Actinomyces radicidentis TaxID=111015 RepID=A0A0X8JFX6_ACTRD|nr:GTPase [Actinomyces radicidentis]AMD87896.1 dGTPase [Actinomyces radicidentis]
MTPPTIRRRDAVGASDAEPTRAFDRDTSRAQRRGAARDLDQTLWDLTRAVELGDGLVEDAALAPARTVLTRAGERRRIAPGVTVVALLGATGSGKSSLFNALTGATIARTAVTRPTTTKPLAALPAGASGPVTDRVSDLLDWLGVDERVQLENDTGMGGATVLLDLPDVDSDEVAHREIATRLAGLVDVLVWVLDPEKYADAVLHRDFIAPMAAHAEVAIVALNQVDRLDPASREAVTADLARLLAEEGLAGARVEAVSARTGEGVPALRERIGVVAATARAAEDRLAADVRTAADVLWRELALDETTRALPADVESAWTDLRAAAARAAGVDAVASAVAGSTAQHASRCVGWVPVRWVGRFRKDPLRALHLGADVVRGRLPEPTARVGDTASGRGTAGSDLLVEPAARTSVQTGAVAGGVLRSAAHTTAVRMTGDLPGQAEADVVARSDERAAALGDALDSAVARTDLEQRRVPGWWRAANWLQWICAATALVGAAWLLVVHLVATYVLMREPDPPRLGELPWPVVLLLGGLLLGAVLAGIGTLLARVTVRRREARVRERLRASTDAVVDERLIEPLRADLTRWNDLAEALSRLR